MIVQWTASRDWTNERAVWEKFRAVPPAVEGEQHVLRHGNSGKGDKMAAMFAEELGWKVEPFDADWRTHGKAAGPIRNAAMVAAVPKADVCWAAPLPSSRGTFDCASKAAAAGIPVEWIRPQ